VFARADGEIWREDDWRKQAFAPAAKAIGIPSPRAYDLRHSFASLLIHEGRLAIVPLLGELRERVNGAGIRPRPDLGQLSLEDLALTREADGRTRTGDPFITSVCRARDVVAVTGMDSIK
jgi:integrase